MPGNTEQLRHINTEAVRGVLKENPGSTKAEIAEKSGLSYPTCSNILNELLAAGEALLLDQNETRGGRPALRYRYNGSFGSLLCVALSMAKITLGQATVVVYNLLGDVLAEEEYTATDITQTQLEEMIAKQLARFPSTKCICIGTPGITIEGRAIGICDIPGLENRMLGEALEKRFRLPVMLENDMNLTALGFFRSQNLPEDASAVALAFPEGSFPGSGIIAGGRILRGVTHFAGEVSFLPCTYQRGTPEEHLELGDDFMQVVLNILTSLVAILNPNTILLTGGMLQQEMLGEIIRRIARAIPVPNLPRITLETDYIHYYRQGLLTMAQDVIACPVQMVEKQL